VATVELRFTALPAHVRTARLVAVSLARRAGIEDDVLDEVRLAVGEAATRAVGRHEVACPGEPVLVRLTDGDGRFVAEVVDRAPDAGFVAETDLTPSTQLGLVDDGAEELPPGIDLAVIGGLVDDVTVEAGSGGSVVRMAWPVGAPGRTGQPAAPSQHGSPGQHSQGVPAAEDAASAQSAQ
jgi:serine/threonine-protein kinase RsbW